MTASEAKANQNRIVSSGFELGWWYGTGCRKCCGVYPKFMTKDTQNPRNAYYQCEVCGRRTDLYTMPWLAEKAWNNEFKEEKKMIKIEVETIEELFSIIGGGRPLSAGQDEALRKENAEIREQNETLAAEVKKGKELLKLATAKADKLQEELDALKTAPAKAEVPFEEAMPEPQGESVPMKKEEKPAEQPTLAEIRATLKALQDKKGTDAVRALIKPYGVKAISQVPADNYAEVLEKAEEALNA